MNQPDMKYHVEPPNSWHMIRALGGVGILCSLLIVFTFQATLPTITRNKDEALEKAIFNVLPGASSRASFQVTDTGELVPFEGEPKAGEILVYAGHDEQGRLVGVAMEAQGQGFQDTIRLLYGYSTEKQQVIGMEVLESKETPGLGDKIIKDEDFLANFAALDASLTEDGSALANPIEAVKILGPDIVHVHAKDAVAPTEPGVWGTELPLGQGDVSMPAFVAALSAVGYTGPLAIEREVGDQPARIRDIRTGIDVLRGLL